MSDTPGTQPRKRHGCLWGCLIALFVAVAAGIAIYATVGYLLEETKSSDAVKSVMARVGRDALAQRLFGDRIAVSQVYNYETESNMVISTTSFQATIAGSKGEGAINAAVETHGRTMRITRIVLVGPDGISYDITHGDPPPPNAI